MGCCHHGITALRPSIRWSALALLVVLERGPILGPRKDFPCGSIENNFERWGAPDDTKVRIAGVAVFAYEDAHARLRVLRYDPVLRMRPKNTLGLEIFLQLLSPTGYNRGQGIL